MESNVHLYLRKKDRIYIIPFPFTNAGVRWGIGPFEHLLLDSKPEEIWSAVQRTFRIAERRVQHPTQIEMKKIKPWYEMAGVKTWRQFVGAGTRMFSVTETDDKYVFKARFNQGSGAVLSDEETKCAVLKTEPREALLATVKHFLEQT